MPETSGATTAPAALPSGTAPAGQPPASADAGLPTPAGEPRPSAADQAGQPESKPEPSRLFKDLDAAERDYKALQAAYTRDRQHLARLGIRDLGELQTRLEMMDALAADPQFIEWARGQVAKQTAGSDDPETQQALDIIEAKAREIAAEEVAPLKAAAVQAKTREAFAAMTQKYGPDWQQLKGDMFQRLNTLKERGLVSPTVETDFDFEFVEDLFLSVAGRNPGFAAEQHKKRLEEKRAVATESTAGVAAGQVAPGRVQSLEDAFAQAKRAHGLA